MNAFENLSNEELARMQSDVVRSMRRVVDMVVEFENDSSKPNPFESPDGKSAPASQMFLVKLGLLRNVRNETRRRGMVDELADDLLDAVLEAVTES